MNLSQFAHMIPTNKEAATWFTLAVRLFKKYDLDSVERVAAFMAQTAHESSDWRVIEENLNYSKLRLKQIFPKYFPTEAALNAAAGKPEVIANIVYNDANRGARSKLGNTQPGDGWRFRGGGLIQLTGRSNYTAFGRSIGKTAEEAAAYVRTKEGALESALWFWKTNGLNTLADKKNLEAMTKRINGGTNGMADRRTRYNNALKILSGSSIDFDSTPCSPAPVSSGPKTPAKKVWRDLSRRAANDSDTVKKLQAALKLRADGTFGIQTESAVRSWQRTNGYTVTGIVTEEQFNKLFK